MLPNEPDLTCERAEARFSAFLEGGLTEAEYRKIKAHIDACANCKKGYRHFQESLKALHSYNPSPVPQGFINGINKAVQGGRLQEKKGEALPGIPRTMDEWKHRRPRTGSLILAWSTAAAAVVVALLMYLSKPEPLRIQVPVERQVVIEKNIPVPTPVEVPISMPVSVALNEGALEVIRDGTVIQVAAGENWVFQNGDAIRVPWRETESPPSRAPVQVVLDFSPLTAVLPDAAGKVNQAARWVVRALAATASEWQRVSLPQSSDTAKDPSHGMVAGFSPDPRAFIKDADPAPTVALVWESSGTLVLETSGPAYEVIPELLYLVEDEDPQVSAIALGSLESIQEQLFREHGIQAPRDPIPVKEPLSGLDRVMDFLGQEEEEPFNEFSPAERWQNWWNTNQELILRLAQYSLRGGQFSGF